MKYKITKVSKRDSYYNDNLVGQTFEAKEGDVKDWKNGWQFVDYDGANISDRKYTFHEIKCEKIGE